MNKELQKIEEQLQAIRSEAERQLDIMDRGMEEAADSEAQAKKQLEKAKEATDPEAYSEAAAKLRTAKDVREMYSQKGLEIMRRPLISDEDYQKIKGEILSEIRGQSEAAGARALELMKELKEIRDEFNEDVEKTNDLLYELQKNIFRMPKTSQRPNGTTVANPVTQYTNDKVLGTLNAVISACDYTALNTERKIKREI